MADKDFTTTIMVDKTPTEVFKAVTNPREWWSENITGDTEKLNDEFNYQYEDIHKCTIKLVEVVPDKKVVWHMLSNYFDFTKDPYELTDSTISFDISKKGGKTQIVFTHHGLVPECECYNVCAEAWTDYIHNSLFELIVEGKGTPLPEE